MLRIEIRRDGDKQGSAIHLRGEILNVGRGLNCDVLLPDPTVARWAGRFELKPGGGFRWNDGKSVRDANATMEVEIGDYRLTVEDLRLVSDAKTVAPTTSLSASWRLAGVELVLVLFWVLCNDVWFSSAQNESLTLATTLLSRLVVIAFLIVGSSVLSRALNHEYRLSALTRVFLEAVLVSGLVLSDFFDLRWLLGGVFAYEETLRVIAILVLAFFLSRWVKIVFDHLRAPWRRGLVSILAVLGIFFSLQHLVPLKDVRRPATLQPTPLTWYNETRRTVGVDEMLEGLTPLFER